MAYPTFTVTVTREDNLWVAVVTDGLEPGVVGAADFERFAEIDPEMREIISDLTGLGEGEFHVAWHYDIGGEEGSRLVDEYRQAEEVAAEMAEWRDTARGNLITALRGKLSERAIADLLGISHQRVNQIKNSPVGDVDLVQVQGRLESSLNVVRLLAEDAPPAAPPRTRRKASRRVRA
ncbi:MerR [Amycolatopsis sp. VS8301801F10]|uniref:MerR n=1 Tax=Amycolatopsis sp. VS8301801F10 TaxID=2652442 RepID=UPI0038FC7DC8